MGLGRRSLVLLPDLDRLIAFGRDHAEGAAIKLDIEDACLAREGPRLHCGLDLLEVVAACPVEEAQGAVVGSAHEHVVSVEG